MSELSREVLLKPRTINYLARRVPPGVFDQFAVSAFGGILLQPGQWSIEVPSKIGVQRFPMPDELVRVMFQPVDPVLLKRWDRG